MVSVKASSTAEVGIVLRFQDLSNYLVGLYNPRLKAIYLLDRRKGAWGPFFAYRIPHLGIVDIPEAGPSQGPAHRGCLWRLCGLGSE